MNIQLNTFQKKYDIDKIEKVCNHIYKHVQIIKNPEISECYRVETYCKEDGSYGTNGDAVFGFTSEGIYIEHNMKYIVSIVPLSFKDPVQLLTVINVDEEKELEKIIDKIK